MGDTEINIWGFFASFVWEPNRLASGSYLGILLPLHLTVCEEEGMCLQMCVGECMTGFIIRFLILIHPECDDVIA